MPEEPKGDRIWLILCTTTGVTVDVTLNKYSNQFPNFVVLGLWAIPCLLFAIWLWRVEKTHGWFKRRFLEHPASYVVMFLIFLPFAWQATRTMVCKLQAPSPMAQSTSSVPSTPAAKNDSASPANPSVPPAAKPKLAEMARKSPAPPDPEPSKGCGPGVVICVQASHGGTANDNEFSDINTTSTTAVSGTDNTIVGSVPYRSIKGSGNTIVGATDSNGNTIINKGGTAIGNGAKADSTSVAIGAHANAGGNVAAPQLQPCIDSNCFQGINNGTVTQTLNQYGAPKLVMTDTQRDAIRDAMKRYAGTGVRIFCHSATEDSSAYAEKLAAALKSAGLNVDGPSWAMWLGNIPPGPSIDFSDDNLPAVETLASAMQNARLIDNPVPVHMVTDRKSYFSITIAPNR